MKAYILYKAITEQLAYHESGSYEKFKDVFLKGVRYSEIFIENVDFASYVYFDFLVSIGFLEVITQGSLAKWHLCKKEFSHKLHEEIISIGKLSEKERTINLFTTSFDLFPCFVVTDLEKADTQMFLEKFNDLILNFETFKLESIEVLGVYMEKYKFMKIYDPITNDWSQVENTEIDGLYRVGQKIYDMNFVVKNDGNYYYVKNLEWAFVLAQEMTTQGIFNRRLIKSNMITIPWKFKLPTLLKRILLASSEGVHYGRNGIEYKLHSKDELFLFLNKVGFYKEAA